MRINASNGRMDNNIINTGVANSVLQCECARLSNECYRTMKGSTLCWNRRIVGASTNPRKTIFKQISHFYVF